MNAASSYDLLQHAIKRGDALYITHYLEAGGDPNLSTEHGRSLLMLAAFKGNGPIIDLLLKSGADINASQDSWTAIWFAAFAGHTRIVAHLLSQGADVPTIVNGGSHIGYLRHYGPERQRIIDLLQDRADPAPTKGPITRCE